MRSDRRSVETLIVGFGFSVIPLLRELEERGQSYTLLSEGETIWQQLAANGRLDFDLVSSYHASFYSQDQVASDTVENYYPTAREFYEYHERLFAQFCDKVIEDRVCAVENHDSYSVVYTTRGQIYEARNLVFATGLGRPQNETIKTLDMSEVRGKTIVFNAIGDTTNMMVSRAVPQGNRVILLNNGFFTFDKYLAVDIPGPKTGRYMPMFGVRTGKRYELDPAQAEFPAVARIWPQFYKDFFSLPLGPPDPDSLVAKLVLPHVFHVRHPETYRAEAAHSNNEAKAAFANGMIGIKYWPIESYELRFGDELEDRIREGTLLNDIVFFHTEGLVETWPKDRSSVDLENQTISCDGKPVTKFDLFVEGGAEVPRLPSITSVANDGARHEFEYDHRDSYLGVVPAKLKNVFFIGFTRPLTGGLANITEMQGLMVHKLISDRAFRARLYADIDERIRAYNARYYPKNRGRTPTDHLVHYGLYTEDVAHFVGVERRLSDCLSWRPWQTFMNLRFDLLHPNNSLKFRMRGEYAVDGAEELARKISAHNEHWSTLMFLLLSVLWDRLLGYLCIILLFSRHALAPFVDAHAGTIDWAHAPNLIAWAALCLGLAILWRRSQRIVSLQTYSLTMPLFGPKAILQPLAMAHIAYTGSWYLCLALFGLCSAIAFAFRQFHRPPFSGRYLFSDCKFKHAYREFWERYKQAYARAQTERSGDSNLGL